LPCQNLHITSGHDDRRSSDGPSEAFDAFELAGWNAKAAGYDGFLGRITGRVVEPLLDAAHVGPGRCVLDVATGPGYAAARAAARGAEVVGVDIAEAMVALASSRYPELEFRRARAERLPFADSSFDAVLGNFLLHHLARPEEATDEFARVLAPGGGLALTVWDLPERARFHGVFLDAIEEVGAAPPAHIPAGQPFFRFADDRELEQLLRGSSFVDIEVTTLSFDHHASSADELWNGLLESTVRLASNIEGQDEETRRRIRAAFERIVEDYRVGAGYELPVSVKLTSCRKPGL
jgi:SAM-dependent methyltransferase